MPTNTATLTPKQREAIYEAWIAALRSGQYKQGRIYLEADGKFCCLGVLCHVLHQRPELGVEMNRFVTPDGTALYSTPTGLRFQSNAPDSIAVELGLLTKMPSAEHRAVENVLMDLNDIDGASFAEIAQFIEDSVMPLLRTEGILPPAQQEAIAMTIINLTQHKATQDQKDAGVVDLPEKLRDQLVEMLTFDDMPDSYEVINRANKIARMLDDFVKSKPTAVMIGGAPFLMPVLDKALRNYGHRPIYAFSKRESVEKTNPDGTVVKTSVFKHAGFVEIGDPRFW